MPSSDIPGADMLNYLGMTQLFGPNQYVQKAGVAQIGRNEFGA